jgi:molybdate-binding protein/DNA-binding XRE family transcriptional regulator
MGTTTPNRVREYRLAARLSQAALAAEVQLTRQSIHAIESSRAMPAVDVALRLATALGCTVETLFANEGVETFLKAETYGSVGHARVSLAHIGSRWISYPLEAGHDAHCADALATEVKRQTVGVSLLRSVAECRENIVLMGCASALGILAARLNSKQGPGRFLWFSRSSAAALQALDLQQAHVAGIHLVDEKTGQPSASTIEKNAKAKSIAVIALARWEVGLVVAANNPKGIKRIEDLQRKAVRVIVREPGSGARKLLDRQLRKAGMSQDVARKAPLSAATHRQVAQAVIMGSADVGIATLDTALEFGLDFVALDEERFDLVFSQDGLSDPRLIRLLESLSSAPYRRELESLGYDVSCCGDRVSDAAA